MKFGIELYGLVIFFSLIPALTLAQTREQTLQAISKLHGPERETKIREGARKEGNLIWYSSTTADDSLVLSQKFQEIYPFVKVQHLRGPSEKMVERILLNRAREALRPMSSPCRRSSWSFWSRENFF